MKPRNIAVVGSGISGLSAAWLLSKRHKVTLIESDVRLGGHANTVDCVAGGKTVAVDTGFIVYNPPAYPNLSALFSHLGVPTAPAAMGFAVSMGGGASEYAGGNLLQLIGHAGNLVDPGHWRLIRDMVRFFRRALPVAAGLPDEMTLGDFAERQGYSACFMERHLLPMAGAIWSAPAAAMRDYPAKAFLRFFDNHGLLRFSGRPQWRTVLGGSRRYVARIVEDGRFGFAVNTPVRAIHRGPHGVVLETAGNARLCFDEVVIATHADQALAMLADPTAEERRLLGAFRYSLNRAILHLDDRLMPRRKRLWSSWNYMAGSPSAKLSAGSVTYWMNALQPLGTSLPVFISLNPPCLPAAGQVLAAFDYAHPAFDRAAMAAQQQLWSLQGSRRTWFCGAHFGAGFHEDGLQAGLAVAEQLGGMRRPWSVPRESGRICLRPPAGMQQPLLEAAE